MSSFFAVQRTLFQNYSQLCGTQQSQASRGRDTTKPGLALGGRKQSQASWWARHMHQSHASWGAGLGRVRLRGGRDTAESAFEVGGT